MYNCHFKNWHTAVLDPWQVFVEPAVHDLECPQFPPFNLHSTPIDFAVTLGGDGTVL